MSFLVTPVGMAGERRTKQTLIPASHARAEASLRPTSPPAFDLESYARMMDAHVECRTSDSDAPPTMSEVVAAPPPDSTEALGRAMYGSYLSSDYPAAMVFAERVLERNPEHALAKLVVDGCRERCSLSRESEPPPQVVSPLGPSHFVGFV